MVGNDTYAYWLLGRLFVTIEDEENHVITWNIWNAIQSHDVAKWEEWVTTPIASPIKNQALRHDSIDNRLEAGISRANTDTSILTKDGENQGKGSAQSPNGDVIKEDGKPIRTATTSSAPESAHKDQEVQPKAHPARIATDIVEAAPEDAPSKPTWFVGCDGCDGQWTVLDVPLLNCADCVGDIQLHRQCHALLMNDQLHVKGFKCKKEHKFIEIPSWDAERFKDIPRGCLPLPVGNQKRGIPLEEWKETLRRRYLPE